MFVYLAVYAITFVKDVQILESTEYLESPFTFQKFLKLTNCDIGVQFGL